MTGLEEFTEIFGAVTIADIVQFFLALGFMYWIYRKFRQYILDRHESEKIRDAKLDEALESVSQYPEYRK